MENLTQFGNYQIVRKIGAGGMADVYEAVRLGLENFQTRVALKCILPSMTRDERFVRMFVNEAHLGSQLQHPNIIQIQDFNKVSDTYYIAMEYVDGVDLSRIIKRLAARGLSFPSTVVIDISMQALAGLGYAHDARWLDGRPMNIIHRDVKPSNFLITPGGVVKIGDFGIAKAAHSGSSHSLTGDQIKGTINYMSPEQIDGIPLTPSADLFSLGAILYEMLTLRALFDGPTMSATLLKIAMVNVEGDLRRVANRYPEYEPILRRALAREPKDRYQNAGAMVEALRRLRDEIGDGLSLREFLAMHKELFEPYGTQPGEEDDGVGPSSMSMTPPGKLDISPSSVDSLRAFEDMPPDVQVDSADDWLEERDRLLHEPEEGTPDAGAAPVSFEYYPPPLAEEPPLPSPGPRALASQEDLGSVAQHFLSHDEPDELEVLPPPVMAMMPAPILAESAATGPIEHKRPRSMMWVLALAMGLALGGVLLALLSGSGLLKGTRSGTEDPGKVVVQQTPAAAPVGSAQLQVSSTPTGARISLDGKPYGALTPTTLPLPLDQSRVKIKLELTGYAPLENELSYQPGQKLSLSPTLVPVEQKGSLVLQSIPSGARIFLNGEPTAYSTPYTLTDLMPGKPYRIAIRLPGYQPWIRELTVTAGGSSQHQAILEKAPEKPEKPEPGPPQPRTTPVVKATPAPGPSPAATGGGGVGTLVLNTVPPDSEVFVDGRKRGEVPLTLAVTAGKHRVEFRTFDGRKKAETAVDLAEGETRRVVWEIEENRWKVR